MMQRIYGLTQRHNLISLKFLLIWNWKPVLYFSPKKNLKTNKKITIGTQE